MTTTAPPPLHNLQLSDGKLRLRPFVDADAPAILAAAADPLMLRWLALSRPLLDAAAVRDWIQESLELAEIHAGVRLAVVDAQDVLLGCAELSIYSCNWKRGSSAGTVGYWTTPAMRGGGVASGALRLLADWALGDGGLEMLYLRTLAGNTASEHVAAAAGFVYQRSITRPDPRAGSDLLFHVYIRLRPTDSGNS